MPGALGGNPPNANEFIEFFNFWWSPPDPEEELDEEIPINTRGNPFRFGAPEGMTIEWIEVHIAFSELPADASDNLRITLVSPDGVHSDLTTYTIPPSSLDPITPLDADGNPTDTFPKWVFTTNRHWGERSEGNVPGPWSLEFENWSEEDIHLAEVDVFFYGIDYTEVYASYGPAAAPGGRIQGVAGLNIIDEIDSEGNVKVDYNFNGLVNYDSREFVRDPTEPLMVDGIYIPAVPIYIPNIPEFGDYGAALRETAASGAKIYVDINKDGLHNDDVHNIVDANRDGVADFIEPYFITGADGNYYFDLPYSYSERPDGPYTTYTIRQEPPAGTVINTNNPLFTESYEVTLLPDVPMTPELEHRELQANFLYTPSEIIFEGTVFTDYNQNGVQDPGELGAQDFVVFIDANGDGIFQYYDINFNQKFDEGIDYPFEPVTVSADDGSYSLSFGPGDPGFEGRGYYTLMLEGQDGWTMVEPSEGFYRIYTESGATNGDLDFAMYSGFGSIFGMVYYDFDEDGIHDPGEPPLNNWLVYIDADNDRIPDVNESKLYTDNAGEYFFEKLALGQYRVRVHAGSGWLQTSPDGDGSYLVDLYIGVGFPGNDFGFGGTNTFDFGDLPAPYPTTLAADGARHPVLPTFYLGSSVDGEPDGQPSPNANGDDTNGLSDEDGILLLGPIVGKADLQVQVTANAANGYLQGWMDFNNNGSWDDAGERVFTDVLLSAGINNLTISVPATVTAGPIYSRFRYAENKIDSYTGPAMGGEVEDYIFEAIPPRYSDGDFNQDLVVDGVDLSIWNDGFGTV
ncbi:MAG: proprotein convertase P-domain-containing protein, partial [Pirellulales bacterium]|nr:proprotein convertase P-domain-containing protein [Pirellulales bacterium]